MIVGLLFPLPNPVGKRGRNMPSRVREGVRLGWVRLG